MTTGDAQKITESGLSMGSNDDDTTMVELYDSLEALYVFETIQEAGARSILLAPNSRLPIIGVTFGTSFDEQKMMVLRHYRSFENLNVGIHAGNGLAFLDCYGEHSEEGARELMNSIEANYIEVNTPAGAQFWFKLKSVPSTNFHSVKLPRYVGHADLKFGPHSYVVAPGSRESRRRNGDPAMWEFVGPGYEELPRLKPVEWQDVVPLIHESEKKIQDPLLTEKHVDWLPIRLLYRNFPDKVSRICEVLTYYLAEHSAQSSNGKNLHENRGRILPQFFVNGIVNGQTFDEICTFFSTPALSKEGVNPSELMKRYVATLNHIINEPIRQVLLEHYRMVDGTAWPYEGYTANKKVYLAILNLAFIAAKTKLFMPDQTNHYMPGVSKSEVLGSLKRFEDIGLLDDAFETRGGVFVSIAGFGYW